MAARQPALRLRAGRGKPVGERQICVGSIDSGAPQCVANGDSLAQYSASGHLVFVRAGALVALPFDAAILRPVGEATTIAREIRWFGPTGAAHFAASADGHVLVHAPGPVGHRLEWVTRTGGPITQLGAAAPYGKVELSPSGDRLAAEIWNDRTGGRDLWTIDSATGVPTRVTFEPIDALLGAWFDDGSTLAFSRPDSGPPNLSLTRLDRASPPETLLKAPGVQVVQHQHPETGTIAYIDFFPDRAEQQIWFYPRGGPPRRFSQTPANTWDPLLTGWQAAGVCVRRIWRARGLHQSGRQSVSAPTPVAVRRLHAQVARRWT